MDKQSKAQPWIVTRKELKSGLGDSLKITGMFLPSDPRYVIATVNGKHNSAGANAALLAAAPQLLNACNEALGVLASVQMDLLPSRNADVDAAIRSLIAAIAKAKVEAK